MFTHYVLESPWFLGIALLLVAAAAGWHALREAMPRRLVIPAVLGLLGVGVLAAGMIVQTSGEHARRVTGELIDAVVAEDVVAALNFFTNDATLHLGAVTNPGFDLDVIRVRLDRLLREDAVESNTITASEIRSPAGDRGEYQFTCLTYTSRFPHPMPSEWIVEVRRQSDGSWQIVRLTCLRLGGDAPRESTFR